MPWDRSLYPDDWEMLSLEAKRRAGWRCVGSPAYPDCRAEHGQPHPVTGSTVVLTTAHLDRDPANSDPANLAPMCQRCHLLYDLEQHMTKAAARRWAARCEGQGNLFAEA